MNDLIEFYY